MKTSEFIKSAARGDQLTKVLSRLVTNSSPRKGTGGRLLDTEKLNVLTGGMLERGEADRAYRAIQGLINKARSGERDSLGWGQVVPFAFGRSTNPLSRITLKTMKDIYSAKPGSTDTLFGRNVRDIRRMPSSRSIPQYRMMRNTAAKLSVND
jgi:hypothetical protein